MTIPFQVRSFIHQNDYTHSQDSGKEPNTLFFYSAKQFSKEPQRPFLKNDFFKSQLTILSVRDKTPPILFHLDLLGWVFSYSSFNSILPLLFFFTIFFFFDFCSSFVFQILIENDFKKYLARKKKGRNSKEKGSKIGGGLGGRGCANIPLKLRR